MKEQKEQRGIQSIEVGGTLLQALVDAGEALPLREIARRAGMTSAKAHPYLVSFGKLGIVEQDARTGHYTLGPFALALGLQSLTLRSPVPVAVPLIGELADAIDHTAALAVLGSHGPTIVYIRESTRPIHVNMRAGTVMSTVNTATGRVFLAYLPEKIALHHVARERGDPAVTARASGRLSKSELASIVAEVREHGLARAVGQPIPGINALSAPVFDHTGAIVLAITTLGPSGSFDPDWNGAIAHAVRACADDVSRRLGYGGRRS